MTTSNAPYVANLVNSIIGVSVLAMPYCMKKCGLILGLGCLLSASWLTYISCSMLVSSAVAKRRRTYEYLAFYTIGPTGKFLVELCMIGLMLGTCTAFYVIIGDLATEIVSAFVQADLVQLRTYVIVFCGLCVALPLGLMKSLAALGFIGYFSLTFYVIFVLVMLSMSISNGFFLFEWTEHVHYFQPSGIFQSLPIFSLAYACQCQLFVVYDSLDDPSVGKMDSIVTGALKIVTIVYCLVAIFGYTTFADHVQGNVLKNFEPTHLLEFIKIGFATSVVVGFPLMIFPCRQSIYTLFFTQHSDGAIPSKTYIEPFTFKMLTLAIVMSTMIVAILIPNVETVLGLTGATMGSFICFILPGIIFSRTHQSNGGIAKFVFTIGCLLFVFCTYSNIYAAVDTQPPVPIKPVDNPQVDHPDVIKDLGDKGQVEPQPTQLPQPVIGDPVHRHEPANPAEGVHQENDHAVPAEIMKPVPNIDLKVAEKPLSHDDTPGHLPVANEKPLVPNEYEVKLQVPERKVDKLPDKPVIAQPPHVQAAPHVDQPKLVAPPQDIAIPQQQPAIAAPAPPGVVQAQQAQAAIAQSQEQQQPAAQPQQAAADVKKEGEQKQLTKEENNLLAQIKESNKLQYNLLEKQSELLKVLEQKQKDNNENESLQQAAAHAPQPAVQQDNNSPIHNEQVVAHKPTVAEKAPAVNNQNAVAAQVPNPAPNQPKPRHVADEQAQKQPVEVNSKKSPEKNVEIPQQHHATAPAVIQQAPVVAAKTDEKNLQQDKLANDVKHVNQVERPNEEAKPIETPKDRASDVKPAPAQHEEKPTAAARLHEGGGNLSDEQIHHQHKKPEARDLKSINLTDVGDNR